MPNNIALKNLWLIGSGPMAVDYVKVLQAQNIPFEVIGRGSKSAAKFQEQTGIPVKTGGLELWLGESGDLPELAIVAVSVEQLAVTTLMLLQKGVKRILVEKPAGLNEDEIKEVAAEAKGCDAEVYVAYNRRFYASTLKAQEIIAEDGGISSFNFEFTEWSHVIKDLDKSGEVKEEWFLANSTHVVDLAFFLGGTPEKLATYTSGSLDWHPRASVYAGAGITEGGVLFSYQANWAAPGRWGVEILTSKHRMIFRPMEQLQVQNIGSVAIEDVVLDNTLDSEFKPGLYLQVKAFLDGNFEFKYNLLKIEEQLSNMTFYNRIDGKAFDVALAEE